MFIFYFYSKKKPASARFFSLFLSTFHFFFFSIGKHFLRLIYPIDTK